MNNKYVSAKDTTALLDMLTRNELSAHPEHREWISTAIRILTLTGVRTAEVLLLTASRIEIREELFLHIKAVKGSDDRTLPLSDEERERLTRLKHALSESGLTLRGLIGGSADRILRYHFNSLMTKIAGPDHRYSLHSLRHSVACKLLERGVNLAATAANLGHKSLKSTDAYGRAAIQRASRTELKGLIA